MPFSLELMWNHHSDRWRSRSSRSAYRWIALKSLQQFPDAVFLEVDVESPLGQVELASLEISVRV